MPKTKELENLLVAGENLADNITYSSFCVRRDHRELEEHRAMYIYKGNGLCKRHFEEEMES